MHPHTQHPLLSQLPDKFMSADRGQLRTAKQYTEHGVAGTGLAGTRLAGTSLTQVGNSDSCLYAIEFSIDGSYLQHTGDIIRKVRPLRRGAILLECMLTLALLLAASLTVLASMDRAMSSAVRMEERADAMDCAVTGLALVEAGLMPLENIQGPVSKWRDDDVLVRRRIDWRISVDTQPTTHDGLMLAIVRVYRGDGSDAAPSSLSNEQPVVTLHQYIQLRTGELGAALEGLNTTGNRGAT